MKHELNPSSLKERLKFLCDKDPELKALLKKRKGQITFFKRPSGFEGLINPVSYTHLTLPTTPYV